MQRDLSNLVLKLVKIVYERLLVGNWFHKLTEDDKTRYETVQMYNKKV